MTINGTDLSCEVVEHTRGKETTDHDTVPRLFLNGVAMTGAHWAPLRQHLPPGVDILHDFKDQLKSGSAPEAYEMESHADEVALILDRLNIDSVDVIGTSYGAEVGMLFALRHSQRCRRLVIIDGVSESDARLKAAVDSWRRAAMIDPHLFYRTMIPWNYSADYIATQTEALQKREQAVASLPGSFFQGFVRLCDAFLRLDITDQLHRINCPTLVVEAELDILKPLPYAELIHKRVPDSHLRIIAGAGHAVVVEAPGEVAEVIAPFLAQ